MVATYCDSLSVWHRSKCQSKRWAAFEICKISQTQKWLRNLGIPSTSGFIPSPIQGSTLECNHCLSEQWVSQSCNCGTTLDVRSAPLMVTHTRFPHILPLSLRSTEAINTHQKEYSTANTWPRYAQTACVLLTLGTHEQFSIYSPDTEGCIESINSPGKYLWNI